MSLFSWRRLTSGSIADANDAAQFAELETLGELSKSLTSTMSKFSLNEKKTWKNNWNIVTKHHFIH
jgi:hypothetical protein